MSEDRYRQLQDAITAARQHHTDWCCSKGCTGVGICPDGGCEGKCNCYVGWLDGWLDTLQAILDLHRERPDAADLLEMPGHTYAGDTSCRTCWEFWPCRAWEPTVALVETALRNMGALND